MQVEVESIKSFSSIQSRRLATMLSIQSFEKLDESQHAANVILIYGASGVGKTYTVTDVLNRLKVPYWFVDAKQFSEVGYQGKDITDMYSDFWISQNYNSSAVESGVIIIDEFDKLRSASVGQKDVNGLGIQQSLLKLIDGVSLAVTSAGKARMHPDEFINTGKITYVFIGAFDYLKTDYHSSTTQWKKYCNLMDS